MGIRNNLLFCFYMCRIYSGPSENSMLTKMEGACILVNELYGENSQYLVYVK